MSIAALEGLIVLASKYGPEAITGITALFKKADVTVADVEAAFGNLKTYVSYGIPDIAPTAPVTPTT